MKNVKLSVIMGLYNCDSTLSEALDSLLSQTFQDFKVIMCEDGSTDNTYNVAKCYTDKYPDKFILIKNYKNLSLAPSLNNCLKVVDTEFVARMDGDDICDSTRFEKQLNFLENHPEFSHVSCAMKLFDEKGFYGVLKHPVALPDQNQFKHGVPYFHAPTIFRKQTLDVVGGYTEEERVKRIEDYFLWYKIHKAGMQGYNMEEPLYFMRNDANAYKRRKFRDRLRVFHVKREVLNGLGVKGGFFFALKDLSKGLVPATIIRFIKRNSYK